ncbi:MAG: hypothetical protein SGILL_001773 [Bacillariaceae sp.]
MIATQQPKKKDKAETDHDDDDLRHQNPVSYNPGSGLDCNRVTLYGILSQFRSVTSIEIVEDNAKSSSCPRRRSSTSTSTSLSQEDACRWTTKAPVITRGNSIENLQGLGMPKRSSQEDFAVFLEETSADQAHDEKDSPLNLVEEGDIESESSEWSDIFTFDSEKMESGKRNDSTRSEDAEMSAALIATIERLAISAALALGYKHRRQSRPNMNLMAWNAERIIPNHDDLSEACLTSASEDSEEDDPCRVVCSAVRNALVHRTEHLDPTLPRPLVLSDELIRDVDRIAVRAVLPLTSAQDSTE